MHIPQNASMVFVSPDWQLAEAVLVVFEQMLSYVLRAEVGAVS
jgi:hypothetical protein